MATIRTCRITYEQYKILLEAFREKPRGYKYAARLASVHARTARIAYDRGWAAPDWARPIKDVLMGDVVALRARIAELEALQAKEGAAVRHDHHTAEIDARTERLREASAVRAAMNSAISALATSAHLAQPKMLLTQQAAKGIVSSAEAKELSWQEAVALLAKLVWFDTQALKILHQAMGMLRLHTGAPEDVIAYTGTTSDIANVDGDEAARALGGEDNLRQAVRDMSEGLMSPLVERLIEFQVEKNIGSPRS